jgi:hypothetical protein
VSNHHLHHKYQWQCHDYPPTSKVSNVGVENYLTISPKEKQYKKDFFFGRAGGLLMEALQDSP